MGGIGSGRPSGFGRDKVEACRSIDINRLHREGCLASGWAGGWQWKRDGEKVASINLRAEADRRKRRLRLRLAEAHRRGLWRSFGSHRDTVKVALVHLDAKDQSERVGDAIRATAIDTDEDIQDMQDDEAMTHRALDLLNSRRNDAYEAALAALREDTQAWWAETLKHDPEDLSEHEAPAAADAAGLRQFLESEVLPWFEGLKKELANRPLIRDQAFGESLEPDKLERLGRYEVHLDRKLERMLSMLLKLKDLRSGQPEA